MMARLGLATLALLAMAPACLAAPAAANPPRPTDLLVVGDNGWRADNHFALTWTIPPPGSGPALVATHFRIRDPHGGNIEQQRLAWLSDGIAALTVPKVPGAYSAEIWLEDAAGNEGPAASAQLRFDNVRPAGITPKSPPDWVGRTAFPLRLPLGRPIGPPPISGIRGYAVAIGADPLAVPCLAPDRCTEPETTLRGGSAGDELRIGALPEGTSYLRAVAVSGAGMKSAASGRATLRVDTTDPVTRLSGAPANWTNRTVRLVASATDGGSGMQPAERGQPPFTAIRIDGAPPTIGVGGSVTASVIGNGVHRIAYYARDAAGNVDDGDSSNGLPHHEPRTATVRIDRTPPRVAFTNSQDPLDPDLVRARIADPLAGADSSRGLIGVRPAGSNGGFEPLPPEPAPDGELRARWSSDDYPTGSYEFRAIGFDAAGNATPTTRRRNGEPMVLTNPLKATTSLRAGFPRRGLRRTVPFGRGVLVSGRLIGGRSTPLPGRPVRVVERLAGGVRPEVRASTALTGPDGRFSIRTSPGPSRTIAVVFEGGPTLSRSAAQILELGVRSRVHLRASADTARVGGPPLVFRGRLIAPAEAIPPTRRSVQLQFRLPGLPWTEFRTVQTDGHGRFRHAYRFSDDDSRGVRFQFRAFAPAQEGWPYEPGGSRPILVRGR